MTNKKDALKAILRALHGGLGAEQARDRVVREVGHIETAELVKIEQELIDEGLPAEEITKFCNVHVLLVQDSLVKGGGGTEPSSGPVNAIKRENVEIRRLTTRLSALAAASGPLDRAATREVLGSLSGLDRHYSHKENLLFPYLEKRGFPGPSKVMWQKDNDVRGLHKGATGALESLERGAVAEAEVRTAMRSLATEAEGMIQKEEDILLPAAAERLDPAEWAAIAIGMDELGYAFLSGAGSPASGGRTHETAASAAPAGSIGGDVNLPSGRLTTTELAAMLDALPFDITFVDADDRVRYFSEGKERIFVRTRAVIGRKVENCHPPKSLAAVQTVMEDLRSGRRDHHDFWIDMAGKKIHIRYYAVRDPAGKYLGTLEVTQDVTGVRALQGQKRLVDGEDRR